MRYLIFMKKEEKQNKKILNKFWSKVFLLKSKQNNLNQIWIATPKSLGSSSPLLSSLISVALVEWIVRRFIPFFHQHLLPLRQSQ